MRMLAHRPTTIAGLLIAVARTRSRGVVVWLALLVSIGVIASCLAFQGCRRGVAVATFNIEMFPRDAQQIRGAFDAIEALEVPVIAVQEILEPRELERAMRERLGEHWRFVVDSGPQDQHLGVAYDGEQLALSYARTHEETRMGGRTKPVLEVRLSRNDGRALRLFVVHLKSGGDHASTRREQLRRLAPIVEGAMRSEDEVIVLGDFNTTGEPDRDAIARFAEHLGLTWSSADLECTAYWNRRDGCRGSALDHVLSRTPAREIHAAGACETDGCAPADRCPAWHREVSDHCPVRAEL